MRRRYLALGAVAVVVLLGSLSYIAAGAHLYQRYHLAYENYQFAFSPTDACHALVAWSPPRTVFTGLYVNAPALLTLRYRSPQPQSLRITVGIPHVTQDETVEVQAAAAFQQRAFKPPLLAGLTGSSVISDNERAAQIHLRVQNQTGTVCDTTTLVTLKSREWMHWYDGATSSDNSPYLAGWVTPHAAAINDLIGRTAARMKQHPDAYPGTPALFGYDAGRATSRDVINQVNAIFDTLQSDYHVYYAQDNVPFSTDAAQRIQLPQDLLGSTYHTGMCVETTAVMASAVEALGMRPYIVIVPGHAFLGVALGAAPSAPIEYWETSDLNGGISGSQANLHGDQEHADYQAAGKVLRVVDVFYERQQGIQPIG